VSALNTEHKSDNISSEYVIEARDIRHTYDGRHFALDGVTFAVRKGEVFGLLGRNGAGKSTLIKVMTTLIKPTSGVLNILGRNPAREGAKIRKRIGVVQQGESFDFTTVQGNFDIYGVLWGLPKAERVRRREELIKRFELEEIRKERSFDLSGGQKRRVQVARELMHDMDILFLDEPTVGLDVLMRRELLDFLKSEVRKGLTVVFTTHNLEEADYLCDRIAVIDEGKIIALETVEDLKKFYGGKKTVEVTVDPSTATLFFDKLRERLDRNATLRSDKGAGIILTDNPKDDLQKIIEVSQLTGVQVEWLNVRKNTLEDVFIGQVAGD
jgi:ABC-2 type transport system ATP-binding protein